MENAIAKDVLYFCRGDVISQKEQPQWAHSLIGDYPLQYHWIYPLDCEKKGAAAEKRFKIMQDVTLEWHGNAVILSIHGISH